MKLHAAALLICMLLAAREGLAQRISPGFGAGAPLNPLVVAADSKVAMTVRYTFGPTLRVDLPRGFGLDVDLLYKRLAFGLMAVPNRISVHRVELPLMLRYVFRGLPARPFMHAGISFNHIVAVGGEDVCREGGPSLYCIGGETVVQLRHRHTHGPVLGAGLNFRRARLRLAPEVRITRWVDRNFGTRDSPIRSNLTQIELLLSVGF